MDKVLTNPTLDQVNAELARGAADANRGQRARTAELHVTAADWAAESACLRAGGEGVANSYRGRAETTVLGCCWVTVDGVRYVRVNVERTDALKSSYGRKHKLPFGYNGAAVRFEKATKAEIVRAGVYRQAVGELQNAFTAFGITYAGTITTEHPVAVMADWLEERGHPTTAVRQWLALWATELAAA